MTNLQDINATVVKLRSGQKDLRQDVEKLHEEQKETARSCNIMAPTIAKLDREIFGNGRPGLVEKMGEVQITQKMMLKAMWILGGSAVTVGLGIIGTLLMG